MAGCLRNFSFSSTLVARTSHVSLVYGTYHRGGSAIGNTIALPRAIDCIINACYTLGWEVLHTLQYARMLRQCLADKRRRCCEV